MTSLPSASTIDNERREEYEDERWEERRQSDQMKSRVPTLVDVVRDDMKSNDQFDMFVICIVNHDRLLFAKKKVSLVLFLKKLI